MLQILQWFDLIQIYAIMIVEVVVSILLDFVMLGSGLTFSDKIKKKIEEIENNDLKEDVENVKCNSEIHSEVSSGQIREKR